MQWIINNKEWLFSGLGITVLSLLAWSFRRHKDSESITNSQKVENIKAGGNVQINQAINKTNQIADQIQITLMSLKQMPGRLQESINSGASSFSFDETRSELEKLYALAKASSDHKLLSSIESFQNNYNKYIELINQAIKGMVTLKEVNSYHQKHVVTAFENKVKLPN